MAKSPRLYSPYDAPMWQSVEEKELKLQKCGCCGTLRYPPGPACPKCLSVEAQWTPVSGKGTVLSWTVFHRQYLPAYPAPSVVLAVQLDEGPIMVSNIDADQRSKLQIGAPVQLTYAQHADGYMIPRFKFAEEDRISASA